MEKILALHIGHDATAMYVDDKYFLGISEERVTRIKNFYGFPIQAVKKIFLEKKINWNNINKIIITGKSIKLSKDFKNFFFFKFLTEDFSNEISIFARLVFLLNTFFKKNTFHQLFKNFLKEKRFNGKIFYYDHHLCHITSSLATYPINNSYLLSLDGGGDGLNWSLYSFKKKKLKFLENSKSFYKNKKLVIHDSPADIYANTTKFLGFRRLRDEGKIMGLSAAGNPKYFDYFSSILNFKNGRFISKFGCQKRNIKQKIKNLYNFIFYGKNFDSAQINDMKIHLKNYSSKEDVSSSLQKWTESITDKFLDYLSAKYKFKNEKILLSGGFFSNVLINQKIKNRHDIKNVYVTPNMGDGGLVLGGIYLAINKNYRQKYFNKITMNVFYGNKPKIFLPKVNFKKYKTVHLNSLKLYDFLSDSLIKNKIIGIINDRMEFGPRALGNRSILANPLKKNITNILNERLKRSDFMPFAPIFRDKDAYKILEKYNKNDFSAKFMTITYSVKKEFSSKLKNIIHLDNTVRAQIIDKKNNKLCYLILSNFYKKSKMPCLINTSFNIHEEPIVMDIDQGIKALENGVIDIIVNEKFVITKI